MPMSDKNKKKLLEKDKNFFRRLSKIDIIFILFCFFLSLYYTIYITMLKVPVYDGIIYLLNAKAWLNGNPLEEGFRPQLLSWLISGLWQITGENWVIVKYIQAIFTISSGIIIYLLLRKHKGALFALSVTILTMLNSVVVSMSTQILTEGLALFFLVLALYLFKNEKEYNWFFAGMAIGLTFASRYPIFLQGLVIFIVEAIIIRKIKLVISTILGMSFVIFPVISIIYIKTGAFRTSIEQDVNFTIFLSPYYLINSVDIWGFAIFLVPFAFIFKKTYTDKFNYVFIAWFIVSLLFWSANLTNFQYRFTIQFMPAVYFLSILTIANLISFIKSKSEADKIKL